MKIALFCSVAMACVIGLTVADFGDVYGSMMGGGYGSGYGGMAGYGQQQASYVAVPYGGGARRSSGSGFLGIGLLGFLFLFFLLSNNSSGNSDQIILVNSTLTG